MKGVVFVVTAFFLWEIEKKILTAFFLWKIEKKIVISIYTMIAVI